MSFLEQVVAARRADARARTDHGALDIARETAHAAAPPRDFEAALRAPGMSLIAELKRASPSAGPIAPDVDRTALVRAYESAGAAAISVLTEPDHFGGSLDDLTEVRAAIRLPVLRKDFLSEPLHLWEARAAGADAALLIVAALTPRELHDLIQEATAAGLSALVEVHAALEVATAVDAGATIIGINTRNLATLDVDPETIARIRPSIPAGIVVVGESGIATRADVVRAENAGCDAVLIGEALMRAPDPEAMIAELLGK